MKTDIERNEAGKEKYEAPRLERLGPVTELTQLGRTEGPGDAKFFDGSVHHTPHGE